MRIVQSGDLESRTALANQPTDTYTHKIVLERTLPEVKLNSKTTFFSGLQFCRVFSKKSVVGLRKSTILKAQPLSEQSEVRVGNAKISFYQRLHKVLKAIPSRFKAMDLFFDFPRFSAPWRGESSPRHSRFSTQSIHCAFTGRRAEIRTRVIKFRS